MQQVMILKGSNKGRVGLVGRTGRDGAWVKFPEGRVFYFKWTEMRGIGN